MLYTKFVEIGPQVPEKKPFLKGFLPYRRGSHLGHVMPKLHIQDFGPRIRMIRSSTVETSAWIIEVP